jgi:hypothetical protein
MSGTPRLSAEYKKRARELIITNLDRFIKRYFNDDRTLITQQNDYKHYGVIEREIDGELKLIVSVSRTSFPVHNDRDKYCEDFVALVVANVNGIDIVCRVDLKWAYGMIGGQIIPQFSKNFNIYKQEVHSGKKCITSKMKKFYKNYGDKPDIEFVDFDFYFV